MNDRITLAHLQKVQEKLGAALETVEIHEQRWLESSQIIELPSCEIAGKKIPRRIFCGVNAFLALKIKHYEACHLNDVPPAFSSIKFFYDNSGR